MKEKIVTALLFLLILLFIPIFITTILNGIDNHKEGLKDTDEDSLVHISYNNKEKSISLEEYLIGVVAAEMPATFEEQALKAQAIAARTYSLKKIADNKDIVFKKEIQGYLTHEQLEQKWGTKSFPIYYMKIKNAVESTKGHVMTYNNKLIDAVYHSVSSGNTQSASDVWGQNIKYLQKVESLEDINSPEYLHRYTYTYNQLKNKFDKKYAEVGINISFDNKIQIAERTEEGYIKKVQFDNKILSGEEVRECLDLSSSNFTIEYKEDGVDITCKGYGHGVGMSQYGANAMAKEGKDYSNILKHYYKGIEISKI